jgi:hypothetical protein
MEKKLYKKIASSFLAWQNCQKSGNSEWKLRHEEEIEALCDKMLPSGSGFDTGVTFNFDESSEDCLVFEFNYHWMNSGGFYVGWTHHTLTVKPSLALDFELDIADHENYSEFYEENDLYDCDDYLYDMFFETFNVVLAETIKD